MEEAKPKRTFLNRLFNGSGWALFTMFVWELVEECFEELIAYFISSTLTLFIAKAFSTLAIISITQGVKVSIKRFLTPLIKTFTYKEGNDKMNKIKQGFVWLFANKKSLIGVASASVMTLSGTGVIDVNTLPLLAIRGFNITPIIYYLCLAVLSLVGIFGKGFENIKTYFNRVQENKNAKELKSIQKEAKKELKAEEKKANQTQAEQEKMKAKEELKANEKAKKEELEREHRAKIEAEKQKLLVEKQRELENSQNK